MLESHDDNRATDFTDRLPPIPAAYGYAGILLSVCFFQSLNQAVVRLGCPKSVGRDNMWKWRNLVVSFTHSFIVGIWDITCFLRYPELLNDLIGYHNMYIYAMVAFSAGYFLHDLIDIVVNKQSANMWEVIPHHIAVGVMFLINLMYSHCIAYSAIALLAEINTIFLHSRKLLQMLGVAFNRLIYRVNAAVNLFTFVACRFVCLVWIGYGLLFLCHLVGTLYTVGLWLSMIVMCPINVVLFWRLLCSDVLGRRRSRPKAEDAAPSAAAGGAGQAAYRIIADGSVPVSVEDLRLACCPPADAISCIGGRNEVGTKIGGSSKLRDAMEQSNGSTGLSDCHRRIPIDDIIAMTGFQAVTQ